MKALASPLLIHRPIQDPDMRPFLLVQILTAALCMSVSALAQSGSGEQVVVYGPLPGSDLGLSSANVPAELHSLSADQIEIYRAASLLNSLDGQIAGVSLNDAQGNQIFQNLTYHGFDASPLQGTPQGIAVYQNGMRLNEAFGDTVNWDAIPEIAVARTDVWSSNPLFGLNALGGAINLVMKDGFRWQGKSASVQAGAYGQTMGILQYGMSDGRFGVYAALEGITDGGWRQHSGSNVGRFYADAGWRLGDSEIHFVASGSQSVLGVVGPTPIERARAASSAVYTWPQRTKNQVGSFAIKGQSKLADHWRVDANAYVRDFRQTHIDGNDADFEACSARSSFGGDICLEDDAFGTPAGGKTTAYRNQFVIVNAAGQAFPFNSGIVYGTLDRTFTHATTKGAIFQVTNGSAFLDFTNLATLGASIDHSTIGFRSGSTLGRIFPDLKVDTDPAIAGSGNIVRTQGNLGYAPADLDGTVAYYGVYGVDALNLTDRLTLTLGFRLNIATSQTRDLSGLAPELTGKHGYTHFNPLAGATYAITDGVGLFASYSEANRAPTVLELDCASQTQPCLLEGSLVADPPLKQVVSHTYETGLRGEADVSGGKFTWSASLFRTNSNNDIVALASVIQGRGFFANVPRTERQGLDLVSRFETELWSAYASYSYLDALYRFTGTLPSPNNPFADSDGNVSVTPGSRIPLNPAHHLRIGGSAELFPGFTLGGDFRFTGSQYFDGDNANQNPKLPAYWVVNLRGSYRLNENWELYGVVNNVFDRHDATFATFFDAGATLGRLTPQLTDPRSVTLEQPTSFQLGVTVRL
jgi:iron complex outermembrane receptor protein